MLKKLYHNIEEIIGSILFVVMLLVLVIQTLSHQGLFSSLVWTEELSKVLFIYAGYLGIVACIKDNSHVAIDVFYERLRGKAKTGLYILNQLLILAALVAVFLISIPIVQKQMNLELVTLDISKAYLFASLPILSFLMIYRQVERMIKDLRQDKAAEVK